MSWSDDAESKQAVSSWKDALVEGTKRAISLGLLPDALPMKQSQDGAGFLSAREVQPGLYIETNASSDLIMQWLSRMFHDRGKSKGYLQITTRSGKTLQLPTD